MKKFFMAILTFSMLSLLSGCCLSHEWVEADCTAPKTCAKCAKTEGEALGHQWADATCTAPKTCTSCAATEGESLEHTFGEEEVQSTDYVNATVLLVKTCADCGAQEDRTGALEQLHDGSVFLMSPEEFSLRFSNMLTQMQNLVGEDIYSASIDEALTEAPLKINMYQTTDLETSTPCALGMYDADNQPLMTEQMNDSGIVWKIYGKVKGKNPSRLAMLSLWRTADPTMSLEIAENAVDLITSASGRCALNINGVFFELYPRGGHFYEMTISVKGN